MLESRTLFAAVAVHVNFQPAAAPVPSGYVADTGGTFASGSDGLQYGWNGRTAVAERHSRRFGGADERYDTFAILRPRGRGSAWGIAVPDGQYSVHLVAGDPASGGNRVRVSANGVMLIDGRTTRRNRWLDGTQTITVTDGRITLQTAARAPRVKLDFIDVSQIVTDTPPPVATPPSTPPPVTAPPVVQPPAIWSDTLDWKQQASSPAPRLEAHSIAVGGKVYVFGGYQVDDPNYLYRASTRSDVYDPATNTWTRIADLPEPLTHVGIATDGRYVYVAGGWVTNTATGYQTFGTQHVWRYDTVNNGWAAFAPLPAPRGAGALVLLGRELHYFGGVDPSGAGATDHWSLDLGNPSAGWSAQASLPFSRNHIAGATLDGRIYLIGGQAGGNDAEPASDVLVWDPALPDRWTAVANLPQPRSHAAAVVLNGRLVVLAGGTTGDTPLSSVISYDPATNAWTSMTPLPVARLAPVASVADGSLILAGGYFGNIRAETFVAAVPVTS